MFHVCAFYSIVIAGIYCSTLTQPKVLNVIVKPDELGRIHTPFHLREGFKPCYQQEYNLVSVPYSYALTYIL